MKLNKIIFEPDAEQAKLLNQNMHFALAKSLSHISDQIFNQNTQVSMDPADKPRDVDNDHLRINLNNLIESLQNNQQYPPDVFGWYYSLVFSLLKQDYKEASNTINNLIAIKPILKSEIKICSFGDADILNNQQMYINRLGENPGFTVIAPNTDDAKIFKANLNKALKFISDYLPELYGEVKQLIQHICLISAADNKRQINGAAIYQLWRLIFINTDTTLSLVQLVEAITHETAHTFLFGNTIEQPLTLNPKHELHYSTFRNTKRPVDGIYHGIFVASRVCWAMQKIINNNNIAKEIRFEAQEIQNNSLYDYNHGYNTIKTYGKLSATGDKILQLASRFMSTLAWNDSNIDLEAKSAVEL